MRHVSFKLNKSKYSGVKISHFKKFPDQDSFGNDQISELQAKKPESVKKTTTSISYDRKAVQTDVCWISSACILLSAVED